MLLVWIQAVLVLPIEPIVAELAADVKVRILPYPRADVLATGNILDRPTSSRQAL